MSTLLPVGAFIAALTVTAAGIALGVRADRRDAGTHRAGRTTGRPAPRAAAAAPPAPRPARRHGKLAVTLTVVDPGPTRDVAGHITYHADDPYALRLQLHLPSGAPLERHLDRESLAHCTLRGAPRVGTGDVRLRLPDDTTIAVVLRDHGHGLVVIHASRELLAYVLRDTYRIVPAGGEVVDVDSAVTQILAAQGGTR